MHVLHALCSDSFRLDTNPGSYGMIKRLQLHFLIPLLLSSFSLFSEEFKVGEMFYGDYTSNGIKEGTTFRWVAYIPKCYDPSRPSALYVGHDGLNMVHAKTLEEMATDGLTPVTVCIGLAAGELRPSLDGGTLRRMRAEEYDEVGSEYPDFLVDEFIPWFIQKYDLKIDPNPDMHMVAGSSSGGISAWNIAWFRNDYFHRCYLASPSFLAIRNGEETLYRVRLSEPRPIRIYETYGEFEPDMYEGNSYLAALFAKNTFEFAGYPVQAEFIPTGKHGAGYDDENVARRMLKYLWNDWQNSPVTPVRQQERLNRLVEFGTTWEITEDPFPTPLPARTTIGEFNPDVGDIIFTDLEGNSRVVKSGFGEITALAISTDRWRLYVADRLKNSIYALAIHPDGSLGKPYSLAPLRLSPKIEQIGASAMCIDTKDRLYVATPLGIQSIISFGILDAILPLPGDLSADDVAFGGNDGKTLYVRSGNKIFKRPMKTMGKPHDFPVTPPGTNGYYDGD